ncbi:class I SAM-dependent methyltransferase [Niveispirillum sp. BGYR6]|uniref:class I SAM-dependent methyltransferase n=1 Tax=Niveispirillum sp. BGYR6 TaxID=2971249 RepID=UPI0022B9C270|nr:class I SAM-dependent methyltransferase [Niveispirillum sp. BGYR6]MDG5497947.1 class I SAM-dependent methyltransferase [Niveispirillum sp. BGYR6]
MAMGRPRSVSLNCCTDCRQLNRLYEVNMTTGTSQNIRLLVDSLEFEAALALIATVGHPTAEVDYLHAFSLIQLKRDLAFALQLLERSEKGGFAPFWVKYMQAICLNNLGRRQDALVALSSALGIDDQHIGARKLARLWSLDIVRSHLPADSENIISTLEQLLTVQTTTPATAPAAMVHTDTGADSMATGDALMIAQLGNPRLFGDPLIPTLPLPAAGTGTVITASGLQPSRHPGLVAVCERLMGRRLRVLDLACGEGGLVLDFLLRGHRAAGLEGDELYRRRQNGQWRILPDHLHVGDLRAMTGGFGEDRFDLVIAWDILNKGPVAQLEGILRLVSDHFLAPDGLLLGWAPPGTDGDGTGVGWLSAAVAAGLCRRRPPVTSEELPGLPGLVPVFHSRPQAVPLVQQPHTPVRIVRSRNGLPALREEYRDDLPRVAVISVPKAGTYLVGHLLKTLGYIDTGAHAGVGGFDDYRGLPPEEAKRGGPHLARHIGLSELTRLVQGGQFLVGHISCTVGDRRDLDGFRKLLLLRDLRDAVVSHMRFLADAGRAVGQDWVKIPYGPERLVQYLRTAGHIYMQMVADVRPWLEVPDMLTVRFETLMGDHGEREAAATIKALSAHIGLQKTPPWDSIRGQVLGQPTKTWSGQRSRRDGLWTAEVESAFAALGGRELNVAMGYGA